MSDLESLQLCNCKPRERASGKCICEHLISTQSVGLTVEAVNEKKYIEQYAQKKLSYTKEIEGIISYNTPNFASIEATYQDTLDEYNSSWKNIFFDGMKICNIGCGHGFLELILYYEFPNSKIWSIDRNGESCAAKKNGKFHHDVDGFLVRTDVKNTEEFVKMNCYDMSRFNFFDYEDIEQINTKFDIIVSQASWCFHYPYSVYGKWAKDHSHDETKIISNIRSSEIEKVKSDNKNFIVPPFGSRSKKSVLAVFGDYNDSTFNKHVRRMVKNYGK